MMTYDPGRDPQNPLDVNPKPREHLDPTPKAGMSTGLWVGILAVLGIATFLMFNMGREDNVATDRPVTNPPVTTGSGTITPAPATRDMGTGTNPPAANTPTPVPAPKQ